MKILDLDYLEINRESNSVQGQGVIVASSAAIAATADDGSYVFVNIGSSANAYEDAFGSYASSNSYASGYISSYGIPIFPLTHNLISPKIARFR